MLFSARRFFTYSRKGLFFSSRISVPINSRRYITRLTYPVMDHGRPLKKQEYVNLNADQENRKLYEHLGKIDRFIAHYIKLVNENIERKQFSESTVYLKKIITLLDNANANNLPKNQREILAEAYCKLADITRVGTLDDFRTALNYAARALELDPSLEKAHHVRDAILSEYFPEEPQIAEPHK